MEGVWMNKAFFTTLALTNCFALFHAQVCGRTEYFDAVGYVSSPNFPTHYANGIQCNYSLRATGQTSLTIFYETIDLEYSSGCSYDWVEIWCSPDYGGYRKICWLGEERIISYASCNTAVIRFRTDSSGTRSGFRFYYAFQRVTNAALPRTTLVTTSTRRTTVAPTTEASSTSIIITEIYDSNDILSNIFIVLGKKISALLILVLVGLLGLGLLLVVAFIIAMKCRSKQRTVKGNESCRQEAPDQFVDRYSVDPTEDREGHTDARASHDHFRETYFNDDDTYNHPYDDYVNADEINTATIGRR